MNNITLLATLSLILCACNNALYFYDTQKVSFTAEARPDSSQPIQGNLGIKQREAIVVPPRIPGNVGQDGSDALSLISHFRFDKESSGFLGLGPISMHSALITGDAASELDPDKQQSAAKALAGVDIPTTEILAREIVDGLQPPQREQLKELVQQPFDKLTTEQQSKLLQLTRLGDAKVYTEALRQALVDQFRQSP